MAQIKVANGVLLKWLSDSEQMASNPPITYLRDKNWIAQFLKENEAVFKKAFDTDNEIARTHFEIDETGRIKQEEIGEGDEKKKTPLLKDGFTMQMYEDARNQFLGELVVVKTKPITVNRLPFVLNI